MSAYAACCTADGDGTRLRVRVVPRAKTSQVVGRHGDAVKVRVAAPPVEGKANDALLDALATQLGVRARELTLVGGGRGRDKVVRVAGRSPAEVAARLAAPG